MFAGKRHFRELLHSDERISSNILTDRLNMLVEQGIANGADDPTHKQKAILDCLTVLPDHRGPVRGGAREIGPSRARLICWERRRSAPLVARAPLRVRSGS